MGQERTKVQSKGLASFQSSELHVQMVGACRAAATDATDAVTSSHQLTGMNVSTLKMGVHGLLAPAIVELYCGESIAADRLHQ